MEESPEIWKCFKRTRQRERVYQVLSEAQGPMSAADIYREIVRRDGECSYAVSTVYRILQAFAEKGMVCRADLPGSDTALYEWNAGGHHHYAICLKCHKRIALKKCPFRNTDLPEQGFRVTGHKVEVYGYCSMCGEAGDIQTGRFLSEKK